MKVLLINRTSATGWDTEIDVWKSRIPLCKMLRTSGGKAELSDYDRVAKRRKCLMKLFLVS